MDQPFKFAVLFEGDDSKIPLSPIAIGAVGRAAQARAADGEKKAEGFLASESENKKYSPLAQLVRAADC